MERVDRYAIIVKYFCAIYLLSKNKLTDKLIDKKYSIDK